MGMRDESWCAGCGTSIPYTEDKSAECGECALSYYNALITYIKQHKEEFEEELSVNSPTFDNPTYHYLEGKIETLDHLLTKFGGY